MPVLTFPANYGRSFWLDLATLMIYHEKNQKWIFSFCFLFFVYVSLWLSLIFGIEQDGVLKMDFKLQNHQNYTRVRSWSCRLKFILNSNFRFVVSFENKPKN